MDQVEYWSQSRPMQIVDSDSRNFRDSADGYRGTCAYNTDNPEPLWISLLQAGAHIRAASHALDSDVFISAVGFPLRSLILVPYGENALRAAQLISGIFGPVFDCPLTIVSAVPSWVGALDIVVILSDSQDVPQLIPTVELSGRCAGMTVLSFPEDGQISHSAKSLSSVIVPPLIFQSYIQAAQVYSIWRHIAVLLALIYQIQPKFNKLSGSLDQLATHLDDLAKSISPQSQEFTNPAKILTDQMLDRRITFVFNSDATAAIASYVQKQLFVLTAVFSANVGFVSWCQRNMLRDDHSRSCDTDDIFYDPVRDGLKQLPERAFLIASHRAINQRLVYAQNYGDIKGVVDITSRPVESELEALEGLLSSIIILDAAILYLRTEELTSVR